MTKRQQELLQFLKDCQQQNGLMPSTREIQAHFGFASQTAAISHLRALENKGVIVRLAGKARAVMFPEDLERSEVIDIPIYGSIAAGMAEAVDAVEESRLSIDVSSLGLSSDRRTFALRVRGESMIDAHICHGDTVILEMREPRDGEIVAALIDGETTLKRFVRKGRQVFLHAENENFPDLIPARELTIQGVMVGLLRKSRY